MCFFDEIFKILFQKTALHIAVEKGYIEIVKILIESKKIDVNAKCVFEHFFIKFFWKKYEWNLYPFKIIAFQIHIFSYSYFFVCFNRVEN